MCYKGETKNCEKQEWMLRNTNHQLWQWQTLDVDFSLHMTWCMCVCGGIVLRLFPGVYRGSVAQAEIRWLVTVPQ